MARRRGQSEGIRHMGGDKWQVRVSLGPRTGPDGRVRYPEITRIVHGTRPDAAIARLMLLAEAGKPDADIGQQITVAALLRRWLETKDDLEPSTLADYSRYVERDLIPELGDRPVAAVTALEIEAMWRRWRDRGLEPRTIKLRSVPLAAAYAAAVDRWDMAARNPVRAAKLPRGRRQRVDTLPTADELRALLEAAARVHPVMGVVAFLAAGTGMRRGEMCALQWDDVNSDRREIHVRRAVAELLVGGDLLVKDPKTHASRVVHVPDSVIALLERWRRDQAARALGKNVPPGEWVVSPDGLEPLWPSTVTGWWAKTRAAAGVKGVRLHDLRHAYATWALAQGMTPLDVAHQLGHASAVMILTVYGHSLTAGQRLVADTIGRALPELQAPHAPEPPVAGRP